MTITEAFAAYDIDVLYSGSAALKTRKNYNAALNSLLKSMPIDLPIKLLTYDLIVNWKMCMMRDGMQPSSMASNLSRLRNILKYCKKRSMNVIDWRDVERPHVKGKPPVWLELREVKEFLGVIESPRDRALFACLFSSGARISELLQLNRDSINELGEAEIIGKGSKPGRLSFDDAAIKAVCFYLDTRRDKLTPLFISGQRRRITVSRVEQLCHEYADMAGLEKNVTPHIFRHSFATDLKNNGMDLYDLSKQLRHSRVTSTMIYVHTDNKKAENYKQYHSSTPVW